LEIFDLDGHILGTIQIWREMFDPTLSPNYLLQILKR
jgi:hypothetical protein